jgi:O-antigen/teichoic acid export membrane protein
MLSGRIKYFFGVLRKIKIIDNISGMQLFSLLRFAIFLIISIVYAKSRISRVEIGSWELFLFISNLLSFFWVTGIIQSLLPLYHRNRTYRRVGENGDGKSPEIFNAFLLLTFFSVLFFVMGHTAKGLIPGESHYVNLLLLYVLLSNPVCLIEYIYLLNNRSHRIIQYGLITYVAQLILILVPFIAGKNIIWSIYGLLAITGVRWIWLIILLRRYTELRISADFMKEHLYLATPLIITSLISGSAQYVDGLILYTLFNDPATFATFRYGAKEFPLVLALANGLSNAMLPEFSTRLQMKESLAKIKDKSKKLMHLLFPSAMLLLLFAKWIYPRMFTSEFTRSADIFMIYSLLIIPRLVFPQTIIIGRKKTHITLIAAVLELAINIPLSIYLARDYGGDGLGTVGIALATFAVYTFEKIFLAGYVWIKMKIKPSEYIPLQVYGIYCVLISILFVLIDRKVIDFH